MDEVTEAEAMRGGRWVNADDVDVLVHRLDVALNGSLRAARRPKLSDIVLQVEAVERSVGRPILWSL